MQLIFGLKTAHAHHIFFDRMLLHEEMWKYRTCRPSAAKRLEKRIKKIKMKLPKKL